MIFIPNLLLVIKEFMKPKSRFTKLSLRVKRGNLIFFNEIATPACPAFAEAASRRQAKLLLVKRL